MTATCQKIDKNRHVNHYTVVLRSQNRRIIQLHVDVNDDTWDGYSTFCRKSTTKQKGGNQYF